MNIRKISLTIKVDKEIVDILKKEAKKECRSQGEIIRQLLAEWIEKKNGKKSYD